MRTVRTPLEGLLALFDQINYTDTKLKDLEAHGDTFEEIQFLACTFSVCNLSECSFNRCRFDRCSFTGCDLSLAKVPLTQFASVVFKDCRLMGINWCDADWESQSLLSLKHVDFEGCLLDHSVFIGLDLAETCFRNCKARHLDFEGAYLSRTDFTGADLEMTRFVRCDLTEANFVRSENYQINAAENTLHKTRFSLPEAIALLHSLDIVLED